MAVIGYIVILLIYVLHISILSYNSSRKEEEMIFWREIDVRSVLASQ